MCIHVRTCNKLEAVLSSINGLRTILALEMKYRYLDVWSVVLRRLIKKLLSVSCIHVGETEARTSKLMNVYTHEQDTKLSVKDTQITTRQHCVTIKHTVTKILTLIQNSVHTKK